MFTVYALSSVYRNYIYVGLSSELEERLKRHNSGKNKTTKPYAPFILLYSEELETRDEARIREKYWKSGTGKEQLKRMRENIK
ncbi:MAG: GIY-YIG nuclease family protein [Nonlabens sp.]|uniref:GIY-YIG nuclease family protein n=1 Tax=Nonlabens sp. TaxID=1888209 RepID=UPI003EF9B6DB